MLKKNQRLVIAFHQYQKNKNIPLQELADKNNILLNDLVNKINEYNIKEKSYEDAIKEYETDLKSSIATIAKKYGFYHKEFSDVLRRAGVYVRTTIPSEEYNPTEETRKKCEKVIEDWKKDPNSGMGPICKKHNLSTCLFKQYCDSKKIKLKLVLVDAVSLSRKKKEYQYRLDLSKET